MSNAWMIALLAQYLGIAICAAFECRWPRVLYFVSAAGITVAILWMGRKGTLRP